MVLKQILVYLVILVKVNSVGILYTGYNGDIKLEQDSHGLLYKSVRWFYSPYL